MEIKTKLTLGAAGAATASLAVFTAVSMEAYRAFFERNPSPILAPFVNRRSDDTFHAWREEGADYLRKQKHQLYNITSARGELLQGYYYPTTGEGRRIAFIVHGYRSEHASTAGVLYDFYAARGFDLFAVDNTACGASFGQHFGYDTYESEDALRWIDFLRETFGEDVALILHGFSLGASTVLKMSDRCGDNVKFIISDSAYRDAREQMKYQLGPLYTPVRLINLIRAYDLSATDVRPHLARSSKPILFVHGQRDSVVPFRNGPLLMSSYRGPCDSLFLPDVRHIQSFYRDAEAYGNKVDTFIRKYVR